MLKLRSAGHEAYLVGGTVRDVLLGGTPKDYDILSSADPYQIKRLFQKAFIVGRTFPVVHVHVDNEVLEVSSFSTNIDPRSLPPDAANFNKSGSTSSDKSSTSGLNSNSNKKRKKKKNVGVDGVVSTTGGPTWSQARRNNQLARDFTVNSLMYDPFTRLLYDSAGGVHDCHSKILRTVGRPEDSFRQDPARILRAIRMAARAQLSVQPETASALTSLNLLISQLSSSRLSMEVNAMFSYGSAAPSLRLLWRHGLVQILFPSLHEYLLAETGDKNKDLDDATLLIKLFERLDQLASPQAPVDPSHWVTLIGAAVTAHRCQLLRKHASATVEEQSTWPTFLTRAFAAWKSRDDDRRKSPLEEYTALASQVLVNELLLGDGYVNPFPMPNHAEEEEEEVGIEERGTTVDDESSDRSLWVGNIVAQASEESVVDVFGKYGPIESVRLMRRSNRKGYGFVNFVEASDAQTAVEELKDTVIESLTGGSKLAIKYGTLRAPHSIDGGGEPKPTSGEKRLSVTGLVSRASAERALQILIVEAENRDANEPERAEESTKKKKGVRKKTLQSLNKEELAILDILRDPSIGWVEKVVM